MLLLQSHAPDSRNVYNLLGTGHPSTESVEGNNADVQHLVACRSFVDRPAETKMLSPVGLSSQMFTPDHQLSQEHKKNPQKMSDILDFHGFTIGRGIENGGSHHPLCPPPPHMHTIQTHLSTHTHPLAHTLGCLRPSVPQVYGNRSSSSKTERSSSDYYTKQGLYAPIDPVSSHVFCSSSTVTWCVRQRLLPFLGRALMCAPFGLLLFPRFHKKKLPTGNFLSFYGLLYPKPNKLGAKPKYHNRMLGRN